MLLKDDPMYAKYFKMLKFGLPVDACKLKMTAEGVDPNVRVLSLALCSAVDQGGCCTSFFCS